MLKTAAFTIYIVALRVNIRPYPSPSLTILDSLLRRNAAIHKLAAILHACLSLPVATVTLRDTAVQRMVRIRIRNVIYCQSTNVGLKGIHLGTGVRLSN